MKGRHYLLLALAAVGDENTLCPNDEAIITATHVR